jgi:hypothetical protein
MGNVSGYVVVVCLILFTSTVVCAEQSGRYIGSEACKDCHAQEYENFLKYAKKSKSYHSIKVMEKKLTKEELVECYKCHTTGYGKPGGFVSFDKTPGLANAGCEVCHGPGYDHATTQDPKLIKRKVSMDDCTVCHNQERVKSFGFKPVKFAGAH